MNIDVSILLKSLNEYNPAIDAAVVAINKTLLLVGYILLSIFLMIQLLEWNQLMGGRWDKIPMKFWMELAFKYLAAFLVVTNSAAILDGLMWLLDSGANLIANKFNIEDYAYTFELGGVKGAIAKMVLNLIGGTVSIIANLIVFIVNIMRFMELYFLKAIAPILLACLMNNTVRPIAIKFFKYFSAYVLIALGLTVVGIIYPILFTSNFGKATIEAIVDINGVPYGSAILSILQGVVYIATILAVGRKMKQLLEV